MNSITRIKEQNKKMKEVLKGLKKAWDDLIHNFNDEFKDELSKDVVDNIMKCRNLIDLIIQGKELEKKIKKEREKK